MSATKRPITAVIALLILTSSLTATAGLAVADHTETNATINGLAPTDALKLFSADVDEANATTTVPLYEMDFTGPNGSNLVHMARSVDYLFNRPPEMPGTWTRNAFDKLDSRSFSTSTSVYPPGAEPINKGNIRDAHATIFAVQPSVVAHRSPENGGVTHYIRPKGKIRALVDFRAVEKNDYENTDPAGSLVYKRVDWTRQKAKITGVYAYADGKQVGKKTTGFNLNGKPSYTPTFTYNIHGKDVSTISVAADIETKYRKHVVTKRRVVADKQDTTDNDTEYEIERFENTYTITDSARVTDSMDVTVYRLTGVEGYKARFPNGDVGYAVTADVPFTGYSIQNSQEDVYTEWRFYTRRAAGWDTLTVAGADSSQTTTTLTVPVEAHAYPTKYGAEASMNSSVGKEAVRSWGPRRAAPSIDENIAVAEPTGTFTATEAVGARYTKKSLVGRNIRVYGLFPSTKKGLSNWGLNKRKVHATTTNLEILKRNETHTVVHVALTSNATGKQIGLGMAQMQSREIDDAPGTDDAVVPTEMGRIVLASGDRTYIVQPEDGEATVTVRGVGYVKATYEPASWINHRPAYAPSTDSVRAASYPILDLFFSFLWSLFRVFAPLYVVYWVIKRWGDVLSPVLRGGTDRNRR